MIPGAIWALVPVRTFRTGKSRLAASACEHQRSALCRAMFETTRRALRGHPAIRGILVATDGADVAATARASGDEVLMDTSSALAAIVDRGLARLRGWGADAALVVMSDLPLLTPTDIDALCRGLADADLVLAPDRQGQGTNALALRAPGTVATCFGHDDSFARHLALGADRGLRVTVAQTLGLAFDVDTPLDLAELKALAPELGGGVARASIDPHPLLAAER